MAYEHGVVVDLRGLGPLHAGAFLHIPVVGVVEVEQQVALIRCREAVAMQARVLGGGEFGKDARLFELDRVVTGMHLLVFMLESLAITTARLVGFTTVKLESACARHKQKIKQIAAAGSAQMRVAEAKQSVLRKMVARTPVPSIGGAAGIGAELHHAKGHRSPRIGVTMAAGSQTDVDPRQQILVLGGRRPGNSTLSAQQRGHNGTSRAHRSEPTQYIAA